ncbi:hypothetical protein PTSG_03437 [Salpingoeca rosetta]|uniref:Cleavage stimulation factor 50 kDa subunit n=1 Tax=Salpingoeca rosetta (strain ATCC 50818 / BSB-021) TaxID=946362 RepID=F2U571_SALR5|nr:uncharacterized protein PTSG_03437 [Salpingoeca rosetta]EGD82787.1 hypothetical protein PTSG_03437 [Salpingoeca rosetta]|eukprot:XP_004996023.1 hypothetical protein PTSG_03437 [Salpingoeca rosetta]
MADAVRHDLRVKRQLYTLVISQLLLDGHTQAARALKTSLGFDRDVAPSSELLDTFTEVASDDQKQLVSSITTAAPGPGLQFKKEVEPASVKADYIETLTSPLTGICNCAGFSKDGQLVAIGCQDGSVRVFDVPASIAEGKNTTTSTVLCKMMDVRTPIFAVAFHPSAKLLVAGSVMGMYVYDMSDNVEPKKYIHHIEDYFQTNAIDFHPSGQYLAVATAHPQIRLYETKMWKCFTLPEESQHTAPVTAASRWCATTRTRTRLRRPAARLATCCKAGVVKVWDVVTSTCVLSLEDVFDGAAGQSLHHKQEQEEEVVDVQVKGGDVKEEEGREEGKDEEGTDEGGKQQEHVKQEQVKQETGKQQEHVKQEAKDGEQGGPTKQEEGNNASSEATGSGEEEPQSTAMDTAPEAPPAAASS